MLETIYQTAIHTPWWVYALLIYLIMLGIKASKTRVIAVKKLFIIPAIFTYMSIHTLLNSVSVDAFSITTWSIAICIGTPLGAYQIARQALRVDKEHNLIEIPGTWSTLIIIMIIFASKYYFGYQLAIDPQMSTQTVFEFSMLGVSGICTGLFIGRLIMYLYRLYTLESVNLRRDDKQ